MAAPRRVNMLDRPPAAELKALQALPRALYQDGPPKYPIDTNVEMPPRPSRQTVAASFPWTQMEVGHSFVVPGAKSYKSGSFWCKWAMKQWPGECFLYRKVENGVRIWRAEATK